MNENSEQNASAPKENKTVVPAATEAGINRGRRGLAKAVLIGTPVILTLASKSALALDKMATVSGQLSGNLSQADTVAPASTAYGYTRKHWYDIGHSNQDAAKKNYGPKYNLNDLTTHTTFNSIFGGTDDTRFQLQLAKVNDDLFAQLVTAFLNACDNTISYGYSATDVKNLYTWYGLGSPKEQSALLDALKYLNRNP